MHFARLLRGRSILRFEVSGNIARLEAALSPPAAQHGEKRHKPGVFLITLFADKKPVLEADQCRRASWRNVGDPLDFLCDYVRCELDGRPYQIMPLFEARLESPTPLPNTAWIAKQDSIKSTKDLATMRQCPADRVGVCEFSVLWGVSGRRRQRKRMAALV